MTVSCLRTTWYVAIIEKGSWTDFAPDPLADLVIYFCSVFLVKVNTIRLNIRWAVNLRGRNISSVMVRIYIVVLDCSETFNFNTGITFFCVKVERWCYVATVWFNFNRILLWIWYFLYKLARSLRFQLSWILKIESKTLLFRIIECWITTI